MLTNIPKNLQTYFLVETHGNTLPTIQREGAKVIYPAFVREETITDEDGTTRTGYRYFTVEVPYTGQNLTDEAAFIHASYAALRKHFYGDYTVQNEQILKGTFAAHQYSVRQAFPQIADEIIEAVTRFNSIKAEFWAAVDAAAAAINAVKAEGAADLTRADFPTSAYSAELLAWCTAHGLDAAMTGDLAVKFCGISADLTRLGRNWGDLFDA